MAGVKGMRHRKRRTDKVIDRIQVARIVNRLESHIFGEIKLDSVAVTAALGLLKKKLPDLAATQLSGDDDKPLRLRVTWES
jgi:hypothetical protein